jgi:acyl carrier protein
MQTLEQTIKQMIIDTLELEEVTIEDIDPEAPLFGEGLGLDSIDALELGLALQKRYGITFNSESDETRHYFYSVNTLVALVASYTEKEMS